MKASPDTSLKKQIPSSSSQVASSLKIIVAAVLVAGNCSAALIGLYQGENNADDSSGNGLNGTMNGGTYEASMAGFGQAFSFDGNNDFVLIASNAAFPYGASQRSISFWIESTPDDWVADINTPFEYGIAGDAFGIDFEPHPNLQVYVWGPGDQIFDAGVDETGWFHVTVTYDGDNTIAKYINGVLVTSSGTGGPLLNTTITDINIGRSGIVEGGYFGGRMDDVAIFDEVLTTGQITTIMTSDFSEFITVPEPSSLGLLVIGAMGCVLRRKRG